MLYYNFNNYEEFKELFGLVKHGNGVKRQKEQDSVELQKEQETFA